MRFIHDTDYGVSLAVEYSPSQKVFEDVRVLDASYAPVGPNLKAMFHDLVLLEPDGEGFSGKTFLTLIQEACKV